MSELKFCKDCKHAVMHLIRRPYGVGICNKYLNPTDIINGEKSNPVTGEKQSDDDWFHPGYACLEARKDENLCGQEARGFEPKEKFESIKSILTIFTEMFHEPDDEYDDCSPQSRFMEFENPTQYTDARYLMALSDAIFKIPPRYGVDQGDHEFLRDIAARLSHQAFLDHLAEFGDK